MEQEISLLFMHEPTVYFATCQKWVKFIRISLFCPLWPCTVLWVPNMLWSLYFRNGIHLTAFAEHHDEKLFHQFVVSPVDSAGRSLSVGACSWKTFLSLGPKISLRNILMSQNIKHLSNISEDFVEWILVLLQKLGVLFVWDFFFLFLIFAFFWICCPLLY